MQRLIVAIAAAALAATAAFAGPIEDRQAAMKTNGKDVGALSAYAKGEKPFDAAEVQALLVELDDNAQKIDVAVLWPAGSETGDTAASPKIWEDMAGFQAAMDKFKADAAAAVAAAPADVEALKAQLGAIGSNCGSCHETFRLKKS